MIDSTPLAAEHRAIASSRCLLSNKGTAESAAWLLRWCPQQARAFALAMHELAAWQYDDGRTEYWRCVLELLPSK